MQAPVHDAGHHGFARQLGAMQEEQGADGDGGDVTEDHGRRARARQETGQRHGDEQGDGEIIGFQIAQQGSGRKRRHAVAW